jgi:DNA-binding NarL/FixJ family response regulator
MVRKRDLEMFEVKVGDESYVVMSLSTTGTTGPMEELSTAEREVAGDAAAGLSNAAIAKKRSRSPRTIANQLASIFRKLGVSSRAELAARLLERRR